MRCSASTWTQYENPGRQTNSLLINFFRAHMSNQRMTKGRMTSEVVIQKHPSQTSCQALSRSIVD